VLRLNQFPESRHHDTVGTQELSIKIENTVSESQTFHWWTWTQ